MTHYLLAGDTKHDRFSILREFNRDFNKTRKFIYNPDTDVHVSYIKSEVEITQDVTQTYDLTEELTTPNRVVILHEIKHLFVKNLEEFLRKAEENDITVIICTDSLDQLPSNETQIIQEKCERIHH